MKLYCVIRHEGVNHLKTNDCDNSDHNPSFIHQQPTISSNEELQYYSPIFPINFKAYTSVLQNIPKKYFLGTPYADLCVSRRDSINMTLIGQLHAEVHIKSSVCFLEWKSICISRKWSVYNLLPVHFYGIREPSNISLVFMDSEQWAMSIAS